MSGGRYGWLFNEAGVRRARLQKEIEGVAGAQRARETRALAQAVLKERAWNLAELLERLEGDRELLLELLRIFRRIARQIWTGRRTRLPRGTLGNWPKSRIR